MLIVSLFTLSICEYTNNTHVVLPRELLFLHPFVVSCD